MSVEEIMNYCEQYREQLMQYCLQYFNYEYEYAEDCVQDAYVALLENLNTGVEIKNYKSWLYAVVLNYKNKTIKDKIKRNEFHFADNEEKDKAVENSKSYNPDYIDQMTTDIMIEEQHYILFHSLVLMKKDYIISYLFGKH